MGAKIRTFSKRAYTWFSEDITITGDLFHSAIFHHFHLDVTSVFLCIGQSVNIKADNELEELHPLEVSSQNKNLKYYKDCVHNNGVAADSSSGDIVKNRSCRSHHVRDGGNKA